MPKIAWLQGHSRLFWILAVLTTGLLLGTAGQNLMLVAAFLLALPGRWRSAWIPANHRFRWVAGILLVYLFWTLCSTALNPLNYTFSTVGNFFGYLPLVLLPAFLSDGLAGYEGEAERFEKLATALFTIWAVICISQAIFQWKLAGTEIEYSILYARARGLYSHPLTLAYVALLLWAPVVLRLFAKPKSRTNWVMTASIAILIGLSQSRAVQLLAALCLFLNILLYLRGRLRWGMLGAAACVTLILAVTDNPITARFQKTSLTTERLNTAYADDRLVFWHAHWEMIKDRPLTGHGIHLDVNYRRPYYERIGQTPFPKKYEAHNQLIQVTAETGVIGLALFLAWLVALWRFFGDLPPLVKRASRQALVLFFVGGLSQNAFMDSEVRYALIACFTMCLLLVPHREEDRL